MNMVQDHQWEALLYQENDIFVSDDCYCTAEVAVVLKTLGPIETCRESEVHTRICGRQLGLDSWRGRWGRWGGWGRGPHGRPSWAGRKLSRGLRVSSGTRLLIIIHILRDSRK